MECLMCCPTLFIWAICSGRSNFLTVCLVLTCKWTKSVVQWVQQPQEVLVVGNDNVYLLISLGNKIFLFQLFNLAKYPKLCTLVSYFYVHSMHTRTKRKASCMWVPHHVKSCARHTTGGHFTSAARCTVGSSTINERKSWCQKETYT